MNTFLADRHHNEGKRLYFSSEDRLEGETTDNMTVYLDAPLLHSRYMSILQVQVPNTAYMFKPSASVFYIQTTGAGLIAIALPTDRQFEPATTVLSALDKMKNYLNTMAGGFNANNLSLDYDDDTGLLNVASTSAVNGDCNVVLQSTVLANPATYPTPAQLRLGYGLTSPTFNNTTPAPTDADTVMDIRLTSNYNVACSLTGSSSITPKGRADIMIQVPNVVAYGGVNVFQPQSADTDVDTGSNEEITVIKLRILDDDMEQVSLNGAITTWAFSFHN